MYNISMRTPKVVSFLLMACVAAIVATGCKSEGTAEALPSPSQIAATVVPPKAADSPTHYDVIAEMATDKTWSGSEIVGPSVGLGHMWVPKQPYLERGAAFVAEFGTSCAVVMVITNPKDVATFNMLLMSRYTTGLNIVFAGVTADTMTQPLDLYRPSCQGL